MLQLDNSTLTLEDRFEQSGGTLDWSTSALILRDNLSVASSSAIVLDELSLAGKKLSLESSTSDLEVKQPFTLSSDEVLELNKANVTLNAAAAFEGGSLTSSGGFLVLASGGVLSGTEVALENSELQLSDNFTMTGGFLQTENGTTLRLANDLTLTGHEGFTFANLELDSHIQHFGFDDAHSLHH